MTGGIPGLRLVFRTSVTFLHTYPSGLTVTANLLRLLFYPLKNKTTNIKDSVTPLCVILIYLLQEECAELLSAVFQSESVCAVHHPHQPICALKVVPPVGAQ